VDGTGNVYFTDSGNNAVKELTYAFVDPTAKLESLAAGNDALPVVLPATENLGAPFAPASSDPSWLTISGITNGVVSFSFTSTASTRTANISVLGQNTPVTQQAASGATPPTLMGVKILSNGTFQFSFTNNPSATFTVFSTTNLLLPVTNWTVAGTASNISSDLFQFTTVPVTNPPQRFYIIRSP
jgi:hypothetical protein